MTETVTIEKQVWESTLHRSMVLQAENDKLKERNDSLNNRDINLCRIANGIRDENFAFKELLKECESWFTGIVGNMNDKNVGEHNRNLPIGNFEHAFKVFSQKINEVLQCGNMK